MATTTSPFLLDRVSALVIFGAAAGTALLFAGIYGACGAYSPAQGIMPPDGEKMHWWSYVYFSIVTQATIGYGDFRPLGLSRLVACLHAGIGIITTGLLVAKITSSAISRYRILKKQACDHWVDIVRHRDGRIEVGILELAWDDNALELNGHNYTPEGLLVDSFHSHLVEDDWPRSLTFRYTSDEGAADYVEGYITVWFHAPPRGLPMAFSANVRDYLKPDTKPVIRGWRVTPEELQLLRKMHDPLHNAEVVGHFIKKYLTHVPELPK